MQAVRVAGLVKTFGGGVAVNGLSFEAKPGGFSPGVLLVLFAIAVHVFPVAATPSEIGQFREFLVAQNASTDFCHGLLARPRIQLRG